MTALAETPARIAAIVDGWTPERLEHSYAPGKWSARLLLVHLAQCELAFSTRARYALGESDHLAQPFDQEAWLPTDAGTDARTALDTYLTLRRFNLGTWRRLTAAQRGRRFRHPEFGELTVDWILAQTAGHELHHLAQFERIG